MALVKRKVGRPSGERQDDGLAKAIAAVGSVTALARKLDLSVQAVSAWNKVPAGRCGEIERLTGISLDELRPDLFGLRRAKRRAA